VHQETYTVVGMTCEHCALSVREEVSAIAGVETAAVDLPSGRLMVRSEGISEPAVKAAVEEAGCELATPRRS
jgi:copper chaperone